MSLDPSSAEQPQRQVNVADNSGATQNSHNVTITDNSQVHYHPGPPRQESGYLLLAIVGLLVVAIIAIVAVALSNRNGGPAVPPTALIVAAPTVTASVTAAATASITADALTTASPAALASLPDETATATETPVAVAAALPTETPAASAVEPTATLEPAFTATFTPAPTATSTPTATATDAATATVQPAAAAATPTAASPTTPAAETATPDTSKALALAAELQLPQAAAAVDTTLGALFVEIPAGPFVMGAPGPDDQQPVREIHLDAYWIKVTEVTNGEYGRCVSAGACAAPANDRWDAPAYADEPVIDVTWQDAAAFARWAGGSLPSEAQWEKACRGVDGGMYPWGDASPADVIGNFNNLTGAPWALPTASEDVSVYGVYDLTGNVREWVNDWYRRFYYAEMPARNPPGPLDGRKHVIRGGAFNDRTLLTCVVRHSDHTETAAGSQAAAYRDDTVGFRIVLPAASPLALPLAQ